MYANLGLSLKLAVHLVMEGEEMEEVRGEQSRNELNISNKLVSISGMDELRFSPQKQGSKIYRLTSTSITYI